MAGGAADRSGGRALPPLDYLLAFEAAAEAGGFAGASRLLHLSETAISRKVRLLEQHMGAVYFVRGHRSASLTPQGAQFLVRIRPALQALRETVAESRASGRRHPVTLAATNSVAALWLGPRLSRFRAGNRDADIRLLASDNDAECLAGGVDLAILRGDGHWPGFRARLMFGETVFPVCAPGLLARLPHLADPARIAEGPLIEVESSHAEWMVWRGWLRAAGIAGGGPAPEGLRRPMRVNTYPLAIEAAAEGAGVALGWAHLVDRFLDSGQLLRPLGGYEVRTPYGYYLLTPENRPGFPGRQAVADWLEGLAAAGPG